VTNNTCLQAGPSAPDPAPRQVDDRLAFTARLRSPGNTTAGDCGTLNPKRHRVRYFPAHRHATGIACQGRITCLDVQHIIYVDDEPCATRRR
jgi:hypothetical protein